MIVYFANRTMSILGLASTGLREGFSISDDTKYEDIDTGVTQFECTIHWAPESRALAQDCAQAGNYLLRSNNGENEFYTIIEVEEDTKDRTTYIYAEDAGMDLLNETVGAFAAEDAHPAAWYIEMFAEDSGFEIGINEISSLSRKLEWTGEATVAERIASVATQFDNAEIGYSFTIDGLVVTHKYINIYEQRGKDAGVTLRLNREVDRIVTTTSVADLATALYVTGGTPEGEEDPVTLVGYSAAESDGDIYTDGDGLVKSKSALAIWSRYVNPSETGTGEGQIVHQWSYDTTSQSELYNRAVTQLKKVYAPAVNYDIETTNMPNDVGIGDYVYVVDEGGGLYLQSRILQMQSSVCNETVMLTLGDYVIDSGGLSSQVGSLSARVSSLVANTASSSGQITTGSITTSPYVLNEYGLSYCYYLENGTLSRATFLWFSRNDGENKVSLGPTRGEVDILGTDIEIGPNYSTERIGIGTNNSTAGDTVVSIGGKSNTVNIESSAIDIGGLANLGGYENEIEIGDVNGATNELHLHGNELYIGYDNYSADVRIGARGVSDVQIEGTSMDIYARNSLTIYSNSSVSIQAQGRMDIDAGSLYIQGSQYGSSDKRLKTSIQPLSTPALDNLTPVSFKWRDGDDRTHYGYIAQEVQPYFPELVSEGTDGMLGLAYTEIIPLLHCRIKEQQAKIDSLEDRIAKLEALINGKEKSD